MAPVQTLGLLVYWNTLLFMAALRCSAHLLIHL